MYQHDHKSIEWAIGVLVTIWTLISGWLFHRTNSAHRKADESRIVIAERHYTKLEVDHLVRESVKPIHDKLKDISEDVKYLVRERRGE